MQQHPPPLRPWECFPPIVRAATPPLGIVVVVLYAIKLAELGYSPEAISSSIAALITTVVYAMDRLLRRRLRRCR
jgi:hypothetical protein